MDISFKNVSYTYQPNTPFEHRAIHGLSFKISSGSFVAIVGHTGSGKSTLIQHLNGLLRPTIGQVTIGGFQLSSEKKLKQMKELRRRVGVVFQYPEHQLFEETVAKDIAFGPSNFGVDSEEISRRTLEAIKAVGLPEPLLERSPFDLSGGQMRRVAIAGVLAMNPEVLVLDEPTAGLDPRGQTEVMDMFYQLHQQKQLTTILVTHSMEDALHYADHVIILDHGTKYMEGKPEEVFVKKKELNKVQLDVPEVIQFLFKVEKKFGVRLTYHGQGLNEIANELHSIIKGADSIE
ncbi:energy-coupling factor ABC transporter ATP-binding protein [Aquibacillus halophilus]|uniref:Energy-coupling factor transporter ATP-binding protein EcfA2 n=1 Tax=Aquibacillus halophilus TaxID=930132 RepID=A0A6A8DGS3_9BACI|nr:energy-coupling factor ABC transporter ATP-binding protein [Aquibacillus halophilus]MRH44864.1 energy-coupling factor ABC transporter ATP-binding protein [Aquibacillus halophilus]